MEDGGGKIAEGKREVLGDGAGKGFGIRWGVGGRINDTRRTYKEEMAHGWRKMERKWQREEGHRIEKSQDWKWKKVGAKG